MSTEKQVNEEFWQHHLYSIIPVAEGGINRVYLTVLYSAAQRRFLDIYMQQHGPKLRMERFT